MKAAGLAEDRPTNGAAPPTTTYSYSYCDPRGAEYHRVYRQGDGPDKKVWQDKGHKGQFFPYRIEHAPDWGDCPVVVVEGEPCADHLARRGYATLSWNGGTNKVTRTRWGALAGRDAILWPDHDAAGLKAMQQLAEILDGLGCAVRWVSVPEGRPGGWDCADATDDEIHRLIAEAVPVSTPNDFARPIGEMGGQIDEWPRAMTPVEFATADYPPPAFLLDGVLTANGANLFVSKPDGGKTTTARTLGLATALGDSFLGRRTRQGPVWYGGFEEDPVRVRLHFEAMGWNDAVPIHPYIGFPPDELDPYEWLESEIRRVQPVLAIVDTLSDLLKIEDESKYSEVRKKMRPLMAIARRHDCCILLCHPQRRAIPPIGLTERWGRRVSGDRSTRPCFSTGRMSDGPCAHRSDMANRCRKPSWCSTRRRSGSNRVARSRRIRPAAWRTKSWPWSATMMARSEKRRSKKRSAATMNAVARLLIGCAPMDGSRAGRTGRKFCTNAHDSICLPALSIGRANSRAVTAALYIVRVNGERAGRQARRMLRSIDAYEAHGILRSGVSK